MGTDTCDEIYLTIHRWPVTRVSRRPPSTVPLRASLALLCDASFSLFFAAVDSVVWTVIVARISASASVILSNTYLKNSSHLPFTNRWRKDFCKTHIQNIFIYIYRDTRGQPGHLLGSHVAHVLHIPRIWLGSELHSYFKPSYRDTLSELGIPEELVC